MLLKKVQVGNRTTQAANAMMHHCVVAKAAHILGLLFPEVTTQAAEAIDKRAVAYFNDLWKEETTRHDTHTALLTTRGGMGLQKLATVHLSCTRKLQKAISTRTWRREAEAWVKVTGDKLAITDLGRARTTRIQLGIKP